jgi:hypothetical protein
MEWEGWVRGGLFLACHARDASFRYRQGKRAIKQPEQGGYGYFNPVREEPVTGITRHCTGKGRKWIWKSIHAI